MMNYSTLRSLFLAIFFCFTSIAIFGQEAMPAMESNGVNYSSFHSIKNANQSELLQFSSAQGHPEYGTLPYNAPCENCIELIEERTQYTRTFLTTGKNGKEIKSQKGYAPLHYQNTQGQWITYNPNLKPQATGVYSVNNQFYEISINISQGFISFQMATKPMSAVLVLVSRACIPEYRLQSI